METLIGFGGVCMFYKDTLGFVTHAVVVLPIER